MNHTQLESKAPLAAIESNLSDKSEKRFTPLRGVTQSFPKVRGSDEGTVRDH